MGGMAKLLNILSLPYYSNDPGLHESPKKRRKIDENFAPMPNLHTNGQKWCPKGSADISEAFPGAFFWIPEALVDLPGRSQGIPGTLPRLTGDARGHFRGVSGSFSDIRSGPMQVLQVILGIPCVPGELPAAIFG